MLVGPPQVDLTCHAHGRIVVQPCCYGCDPADRSNCLNSASTAVYITQTRSDADEERDKRTLNSRQTRASTQQMLREHRSGPTHLSQGCSCLGSSSLTNCGVCMAGCTPGLAAWNAAISGTPSCPLRPQPHAYTAPCVASARLCFSPAAAATMRTPLQASASAKALRAKHKPRRRHRRCEFASPRNYEAKDLETVRYFWPTRTNPLAEDWCPRSLPRSV